MLLLALRAYPVEFHVSACYLKVPFLLIGEIEGVLRKYIHYALAPSAYEVVMRPGIGIKLFLWASMVSSITPPLRASASMVLYTVAKDMVGNFSETALYMSSAEGCCVFSSR